MIQPRVYIVIVNYNGWEDTIECLESVLRSDYQNFQVIVVDNASRDNSVARISAWAQGTEYARVQNSQLAHLTTPPVPKPIECVVCKHKGMSGNVPIVDDGFNNPLVLVQAEENNGLAAGNNIGIHYLVAKRDADYIWLLNNDTVIEPNALKALVRKGCAYKEQKRRIGIIGAKLMYYHLPAMIQGVAGVYNRWLATSKHLGCLEEDRGQYDSEGVACKMDYPIGASLFVSVAFIKDVGLMSEDYFLYFEEIDWTTRGKAKGWQTGYCWQARVFHKEGGSTGTGLRKHREISETGAFYFHRSRILFTRKFFPRQLLAVKVSFILVLMNYIRMGKGKMLRLIMKAYSGTGFLDRQRP